MYCVDCRNNAPVDSMGAHEAETISGFGGDCRVAITDFLIRRANALHVKFKKTSIDILQVRVPQPGHITVLVPDFLIVLLAGFRPKMIVARPIKKQAYMDLPAAG